MKPPAFQLYADRFLAGTVDMTNEEVGAYIRLLCHQWIKGGLPDDPERISRMAGAISRPSLGYVLAKFRPSEDGMLRNEMLEKVRSERAKFAASQSNKGKLGAEKRWKNSPGHNPAMAQAIPENGSTSTSTYNNTRAVRGRDALMDQIALLEVTDLKAVTRPAWSRYAKVKSDILSAAPDVTPEEIKRRFDAYVAKYPGAAKTATALASRWAEFPATAKPNGHNIAVWGEPA